MNEAATQGVQTTAFQYGVVGVIALVFAYVIVFLYRQNSKERETCAQERKEYEATYNARVEALRLSYDLKIEAVRTHFDETVDALSLSQRQQNASLVDVLEKIRDRFFTPRSGQ